MTSARDFVGIVVAAGRSTRFGGGTPKQFLDLCGRSVVDRAIDCVGRDPSVRGVVLVVPPGETGAPEARTLGRRPDVLAVVAGGAARADSVRAGIEAAGDAAFVLVHDAARPLAGADLVRGVVAATRLHGAAIPALSVPDTVKRVVAGSAEAGAAKVGETLDRAALCLAQTPQGARTAWLREALDEARRRGQEPTDEAAALELVGRPVAIVPGAADNRKITTREDLDAARRRLEGPGGGMRVGTGFDVHRFGPGRRLVLGGVEFTGEEGLAGHSDADVVLHAAMDAVLGAAGLGDIGALFPPDDAGFEGADSAELTREVARRIAEAGYEVINLDLTVLAERPRIRDRVEAMRRAIAAAFGITADRVGLKATTLEQLGALGRAEGIACQGVALLRRAERG